MKYFFLSVILVCSGCKKLLQIPDGEKLKLADQVFGTKETANEAILGIYSSCMDLHNINSSITVLGGLVADELTAYTNNENYKEYELNNITPHNVSLPWKNLYKIIYQSNDAITRIDNSSELDITDRNYFKGEALFIRAYAYYLLVNFFGEVPLLLSTDVQKNSMASRTAVDSVYSQVITDLKESISLLQSDRFGTDRNRINKWSASALLSRVYLYRNLWEEANDLTTAIISSGVFLLEEDINNAFLISSKESLFFFENYDFSGLLEPTLFIFQISPTIVLSDNFINAIEPGDLRMEKWVEEKSYLDQNVYYPVKYKIRGINNQERYVLFRLAEQYLIRSEARAHLNRIPEAVQDINIIRGRVNLPLITEDISKDSCLQVIYKERRYELFAETPHRWFDLKRTGQATIILNALKPATWIDSDTLFPLPYNDIITNPNLHQNRNY